MSLFINGISAYRAASNKESLFLLFDSLVSGRVNVKDLLFLELALLQSKNEK
jgi:hypothetical protein